MTTTEIAVPASTTASLPALVDRASQALAGARTAAEVLEAREMASFAYDAAKRTARLAKAKQAHDDLIGAAYRAQADALEIEASAKRRLADEYDAAQERGEIAKAGNPNFSNSEKLPGWREANIPAKELHEARTLRDAEQASPGIVRKATDEAIAGGKEPSRSHVRRIVREAAGRLDPVHRPAQGRDAIRARVKDAIVVLSGLPAPAEVVGYFRGTDEAMIVDERLTAAVRWLDEFAETWGDENDS